MTASLNGPSGVAFDSADNLYIADEFNNRIREVSIGIITTVAGTGTRGFLGDQGPATSAWLNHPYAVALDSMATFISRTRAITEFGRSRAGRSRRLRGAEALLGTEVQLPARSLTALSV